MAPAKSGSALASKEDHVPDQDNIQAEEEETFFQDVDELQKFGINVADLTKLKQSGICTIKGVQMCTRKTLLAIKGISEAKVDKIKEASAKLVEAGFITAMDFAIKRDKVMRISTGSAELDKLLGGGIETQSITEAFGEFRTGKTQLCHTLCVTTQLPTSMGGANGKVAYIDTEGTFRPERLRQISERFNIDADAVLENVIFTRVYNSDTQMDALTILAAKFHEEGGVYRLIIVDSIIALFRVDYSGRGELSERQQKLNQMLSRLIKLAEEWNCAVFITNQMTADPAGGMTFVADPKKPVGGNILAHASTTRLSLRKGRGEQRICKIYDSPNLPESEAVFQIGAGGITDAKD